jgi:hypothetical protein
MSEDLEKGQPQNSTKQKTRAEKQAGHVDQIKRTLVACLLGFFTGVLSYVSGGVPDAHGLQNSGLLGFMLMLAGIVMQRHIFMFIGIDTTRLGGKDWFYQGFMTFALWFMTWTILLSSMAPVADFSANITSGNAPLAVTFNDTSTNTPASWNWSFGDGNFSTVQNPVKTYAYAGNFTVNLTAANTGGRTTKTRLDYISITSASPH